MARPAIRQHFLSADHLFLPSVTVLALEQSSTNQNTLFHHVAVNTLCRYTYPLNTHGEQFILWHGFSSPCLPSMFPLASLPKREPKSRHKTCQHLPALDNLCWHNTLLSVSPIVGTVALASSQHDKQSMLCLMKHCPSFHQAVSLDIQLFTNLFNPSMTFSVASSASCNKRRMYAVYTQSHQLAFVICHRHRARPIFPKNKKQQKINYGTCRLTMSHFIPPSWDLP